MSITTVSTSPKRRDHGAIAPLRNGDHLTQTEFHRRYEAYPENVTFELISGVVYMPSPLGWSHAMYHFKLTTVLGLYEAATPGVEGGDNATVILGDAEEPQPDLILRILSEFGGRTRTTPDRNYITGPPELVIEIAHSSVAIDLHAKKDDYQRTGVLEYIVVCLEEQEVRWFDLPSDRQLALDPDGILRARVFPGLWIDTAALFRQDTKRLTEVAQQGLAAPEHAEFAQRLETSRSSAESP